MTPRPKHWLISLSVILTLVVLGGGFLFLTQREPVYQAKTLHVWLKEYRYVIPSNIRSFRVPGPTFISSPNSGPFAKGAVPITGFDEAGHPLVVTNHTAEAIRAMGPKVVPSLIRILQENDSGLQQRYRSIVKKFPVKVRQVLPQLPPPNLAVQVNAAKALADFAPGEIALPVLLQTVQGTNQLLKIGAIGALARLGTNAIPAVPELLKVYHQPGSYQQLEALGTLGSIAPRHPLVLTELQQATTNVSEPIRGLAVQVLSSLKPLEPSSLPALRTSLQDSEIGVSFAASLALCQNDLTNPATVQALRAYCKQNPELAKTLLHFKGSEVLTKP